MSGTQSKPLELSRGSSSQAGGADGITQVAFITFIFGMRTVPWHPEIKFVIGAIVVYQAVLVSNSNYRLFKRQFGGQ
jgi:hypothetical protein